jgi:hypothetical protein
MKMRSKDYMSALKNAGVESSGRRSKVELLELRRVCRKN